MPRAVAVLVMTCVFVLLGAPRFGEAQARTKTGRVGVIGVTPMAEALRAAFVQGLGQSGHAEGRDIVIDERQADGQAERLSSLAADLVRLKVDVVFARGPAALATMKKTTGTIPIVAVDLETDPIARGFAKNIAKPAGNVTGVFLDLPELSGKQIQLFKEIVPGVSRVAVLGDPEINSAQFRATETAARTLGVQLQMLEARTAREVDTALESARRGRAGAVILLSSPIVFAARARIAAMAVEKRLPVVSLFSEVAEVGGLMSYGPSLSEAFRRCGVSVGKILSGARPGDLPIERPEKFELTINLRTASALGLTIPQLLQLRADQLIQ